MKYLLHIDTSTDTSILAIGCNGELLTYSVNEESRNHAGTINNSINKLLINAEISFEQISAVVVCAGPGSYTGLRIGLATAKGLCYALDKPLILDNKLTLLANNASNEHPNYSQYISLLIAREKEYFISIYNNKRTCILQPQHISEEQLSELIEKNKKTFFISNAEKETIEHLIIDDLKIDNNIKTPVDFWISAAFEKYNCNHFVNLMEAEPFYLKQVYTHK